MAGTKIGGLRAAETNKKRYGNDMYVVIGRAGGLKSRGGGFAKNHELAKKAGTLGGKRRTAHTMCRNGHKYIKGSYWITKDGHHRCKECYYTTRDLRYLKSKKGFFARLFDKL